MPKPLRRRRSELSQAIPNPLTIEPDEVLWRPAISYLVDRFNDYQAMTYNLLRLMKDPQTSQDIHTIFFTRWLHSALQSLTKTLDETKERPSVRYQNGICHETVEGYLNQKKGWRINHTVFNQLIESLQHCFQQRSNSFSAANGQYHLWVTNLFQTIADWFDRLSQGNQSSTLARLPENTDVANSEIAKKAMDQLITLGLAIEPGDSPFNFWRLIPILTQDASSDCVTGLLKNSADQGLLPSILESRNQKKLTPIQWLAQERQWEIIQWLAKNYQPTPPKPHHSDTLSPNPTPSSPKKKLKSSTSLFKKSPTHTQSHPHAIPDLCQFGCVLIEILNHLITLKGKSQTSTFQTLRATALAILQCQAPIRLVSGAYSAIHLATQLRDIELLYEIYMRDPHCIHWRYPINPRQPCRNKQEKEARLISPLNLALVCGGDDSEDAHLSKIPTIFCLLACKPTLTNDYYQGQTPLHWAIQYSLPSVVQKILKEGGAHLLTLRNATGELPLDIALGNRNKHIAKILYRATRQKGDGGPASPLEEETTDIEEETTDIKRCHHMDTPPNQPIWFTTTVILKAPATRAPCPVSLCTLIGLLPADSLYKKIGAHALHLMKQPRSDNKKECLEEFFKDTFVTLFQLLLASENIVDTAQEEILQQAHCLCHTTSEKMKQLKQCGFLGKGWFGVSRTELAAYEFLRNMLAAILYRADLKHPPKAERMRANLNMLGQDDALLFKHVAIEHTRKGKPFALPPPPDSHHPHYPPCASPVIKADIYTVLQPFLDPSALNKPQNNNNGQPPPRRKERTVMLP